jgi:hypothetical protein
MPFLGISVPDGPYIRGWINDNSHFYKSAMHDSLRRIDFHLSKWARRKFKRFKQRPKRAREWLAVSSRSTQSLLAHQPLLYANSRILGAGWAETLTSDSESARW